MAESERGPVADAVAEAMLDRNLTPHQIRLNGGPREGTLYFIRVGTTRHPKATTLDALAKALATHVHSKRLDIAVMRRLRHTFYVAAGYAEQDDSHDHATLEQILLETLGDVVLAHLWATFTREHMDLDMVTLIDAVAAFRAVAKAARALE